MCRGRVPSERKKRTSDTLFKCAGIVYRALSERMSHIRIVSSDAPVAI